MSDPKIDPSAAAAAQSPASHPSPPAEQLDAPVRRQGPDPEATQILTSSGSEMMRHLEEQLAAADAARLAKQQAAAAAAAARAQGDGEGQTAIPIAPELAARLSASSAEAPTLLQPRVAPQPDPAATVVVELPTAVPRGPGRSGGASGTDSTAGPESSHPTGGSLLPAATPPTTYPRGGAVDSSFVTGESQMRQVGRYLVKARLGRGGMATVYRASDPQIGRDVAIKFLHSALSQDDECRMRFLREARAAGGLSHPNIVVVHDVGEIEHRPYMAMELIDGSPLSERLEKTKTLPVRDVVVIGLQLARALEYAHARGIVHRDIKPGNIMLLGDGQTIKVADFGIAHMDEGTGEQRTLVGAVMGTPQYMSPEQTRGDKVDGRSDLFSAGIVMYQMLAGERPFRGDTLVAVATRIANEDAAPLNQKRPEVPASLRRVVDRCLAKKPEQRYQTGKELAEALLKVLGEIDEAARERDKPRIMPLRVKWALMMGLIVAVVMGSTAAFITQRQYAAMMGQVSDYGASLARFIAAQNAASVLGEEWEPVDVAVQEIMKTRSFERISVVDLAGVVRVSSVPELRGLPYQPIGTPTGSGANAPVRFSSQGQDVLGFEAPVLFQGKQVGRVALGIPEAPLTEVARLSISLMIVLAVVTVLAVAIAMYFVANWFAKPIRLVGDSMAEIGKGRFDHRIAEQRNDEFGQLFQAFDAMAQALQQRVQGTPAAPSTLPGATPAPAAATAPPAAQQTQQKPGGSGG
jgi:HAMP domain-containing protein/predicted Ser/Thr protein kinase